MARSILGALLVLSLSSCAAAEPVGTTHLTASNTWQGAHAELLSAPTSRARVEGEILWPARIQGGPPPMVLLAATASSHDTTALALKLAGRGVATLRFSSPGAADGDVVAACVDALRRDPRVGRIVLLADEDAEGPGGARVDARVVVPAGARPSEILRALSRHAPE